MHQNEPIRRQVRKSVFDISQRLLAFVETVHEDDVERGVHPFGGTEEGVARHSMRPPCRWINPIREATRTDAIVRSPSHPISR